MQLDFGFVSICLSEKDCSPAGNVTVKQVKTLEPEQRRARILRVAKRNLENTLRIMWFLDAHGFKVYRLSANLVPLATHEITRGWAWWEEEELLATGARIGQVAREKGYRLELPSARSLRVDGRADVLLGRAVLGVPPPPL